MNRKQPNADAADSRSASGKIAVDKSPADRSVINQSAIDQSAFNQSAVDDPRVLALVAEYQRELDAGRRPDRERYLKQHPELAEAVAACIDGLDLLLAHRPEKPSNRSNSDGARSQLAANVQLANPLGDFQILRELARGGMGIVYEAIQLSLNRRVAIKVLPFAGNFNSRQLQRFKNEAQAAALLHHTHIVPIYAIGCERGVHFYAMQLIDGHSLAFAIKQLRAQSGRANDAVVPAGAPVGTAVEPAADPFVLAPAEAQGQLAHGNSALGTVDIANVVTSGAALDSEAYVRRISALMLQAAEALEHAHQMGVIHRDIKPGNLLIDSTGDLWVTDFGLAQLQSADPLTRSGDVLGTFRYMSPEQFGGERSVMDHRTDLYSLGATFYELLTLEPVFSGDTRQGLLYQILHQEPRSLRTFNRAISPELETVVLKALSKSPADRYATAADFAADIRRTLNHEPVLARRPTLVHRARKWLRRNPAFAIAGVLLLVVVVIASLISNRMIGEEQRRTAEAWQTEKARANESETNFQQALQAVDALLQVSEEDLVDKPELDTRRRILEIVLSFYQDFSDQRSGHPASQAQLTALQEKVKGILSELKLLRDDMSTRLLGNPEVRGELRLTSEQQQKVQGLLTQWTDDRRENLDQLKTKGSDERRKQLVADAQQRRRELENILTAAQLARFKQLALQSEGISAFREPEVADALRLSDEQRAKLREIEHEVLAMHQPPSGPGMNGFPPDRPKDGRPPPEGPKEGRLPPEGPDGNRPPPGQFGPKGWLGGPGDYGPPGEPGSQGEFGPNRRPPGQRGMFGPQQQIEKALAILNDQQLQTWRELVGAPFYGFGDFQTPGGPPGRPPRF